MKAELFYGKSNSTLYTEGGQVILTNVTLDAACNVFEGTVITVME